MPKRKKDDDKRIERYLRKIKRIKDRRGSRGQRSPSSYFDSEDYYPDGDMTPLIRAHNEEVVSNEDECVHLESDGESSRKEENQPLLQQDQENVPPAQVDQSEVTLDSETLKALGKPVKEKQIFGPNINGDLAKLWTPILKNGLGDYKEKQQMLEKYLVPNNCQLLQAPKLNPEIVATVTDTIRNRDKKIEEEQQQLGYGLTALNKALTLLATNTGERSNIINILSEASQILSDLHYTQTQARKRLITPILDKIFLDLVKDTDRDTFLYGSDLSEKIKAMKYTHKSSHSIKKSYENFKPYKKPGQTYGQANYKGPPRFQQKPYNRSGPKRPSDRSSYTSHYKSNPYNTKKSKPEGKAPARK